MGRRPKGTENDILQTQALIVTCGPFEGRICENDDDEFLFREDMSDHVSWIEEENVVWRSLTSDDLGADYQESENYEGVDCEIVTFGYYPSSRGYYVIPRQFLRPATMRDLVQRLTEIQEEIHRRAWDVEYDPKAEDRHVLECLLEKEYILAEIREREQRSRRSRSKKNIFLCHASKDKPFVRTVMTDLANEGHRVWIDEFEISVGDSIVEKIDSASTEADALILFASKAAMEVRLGSTRVVIGCRAYAFGVERPTIAGACGGL